ncbi:hypothetical protein VTN77DRAFT_1962 [Rasamsonia byssochlamydoides]|uniref:uncharacterized protein n=1 Tax=Rasamsonia byssochlamydoides TaxID=89139 RepID=UPI003743F41B
MAGSIRDWPRLVQQCYDHLKPGGWIEFQESANTLYSEDDSFTPDNKMVEMMNGLMDACDQISRTMDPALSIKGWVEDAGFTKEVQVAHRSLAQGPATEGDWNPHEHQFYRGGGSLHAGAVHGGSGMVEGGVAVYAGVRVDVQRKDVHPLFDFLVITAQKPE